MVKHYPHLPIDLVNSLKKEGQARKVSFSHIPEFRDIRLQILDSRMPDHDSNTLFISCGDYQGYPAGARLAWLHQAATFGDVIFACELIRLGANVDILDSDGFTPLLVAMQMWGGVRASLMSGDGNICNAEKGRNTCKRLRKLVIILIQHHADVNTSADGRTALQYACMIHDWDIIELLIQYGANPCPSHPAYSSFRILSAEGAQRLKTIIDKYAKQNSKPLLPCPCFSGLSLVDCHAKSDKPYPDHHVCVCGSEKLFGSCCGLRNVGIHEEWDEVNHRIKIQMTPTISDPVEECADHPLYTIKREIQKQLTLGPGRKTVDTLRQLRCWQKVTGDEVVGHSWKVSALSTLEDIGRTLGITDPAFNYASERADFTPWPTGKQRSKIFCRDRQMRWNALVDEYIQTSSDKRPKIEIERAAKLGSSLGALYPVCDGNDCKIRGGGEVNRLCTCSGCKMALYCGPECQKRTWASHKRVCGMPGQREQALPSQEKLDHFVWEQLIRMDGALETLRRLSA
ncbi:hypothetical protein PILCRDRAFT_7602 [Piloderma croceum F 1598]|uniref:MYND-type domain-containing protein n=1 Tax=Piloderma croceum (strain F 1598) TaxID=765440 RepID=A0A0C3FSP6_PILCF|nr:hypothetical protein PILCRDRAFT_7602 [Piloderma croceum F 1598]